LGAKKLNQLLEQEKNITQYVSELQKFPVFMEFENKSSSEEALQKLIKYMSMVQYRESDKIIVEGKVDNAIYFLLDGSVEIFKPTDSGDFFKVAEVKSDSYAYFGEGGILDEHQRSVTIKAVNDVMCLVLTKSSFEKFCKDYPQYGLPILRFIARKTASRLRKVGSDFIFLYHAYVKEIRGHN
jgi:CRP-like cAMP-binding protein